MGTPVPPIEPVNPGEPCPACWGEGKPFGDNPTPKHVTVTLSGILPGEYWEGDGEPSLNGTFDLTQVNPCIWHGSGYLTAIQWHPAFDPTTSYLAIIVLIHFHAVFLSTIPTACMLSYSNSITAPQGVSGFGGIAMIDWTGK